MPDVPRELRELIINDRPAATAGGEIIKNWTEAQLFWRRGQGRQPDIILCDINFEKDNYSPLHLAHAYKPTGLLYALPFLALAKANSLPIVLKFHTADPTLFSRRHRERDISNGTKPPHVMSYLAAELVGLVMAMLEVTPEQRPVDLDGAWEWLGSRDETFEDEDGARVAARMEYRKRLAKLCRSSAMPGLIVDPEGYRQVITWSERTATKRIVSGAEWEEAPGLVVLRADGTRDCLSIRSLFHPDDRFVPARFQIRKSNSEEFPAPDAWLSKDEARIGEFLYDLGDWPRIYDEAVQAIGEFPQGGTRSPVKFNDAIPSSTAGYKLIRVVALVFQAIRLFHNARECWRRSYLDHEWDPRKMAFGKVSEEDTLRHQLETAHAILGKKSDWAAPMSHAEINNALAAKGWAGLKGDYGGREQMSEWVHFHIDMLASIGLARSTARGHYMVRKPFPADLLPPCPPNLRPDWIKHLVVGLAESIGSTEDGAHQELRRISAEALFDGVLSEGTQFNKRMCGGSLPAWLRELGREYAVSELKWHQDCHWPDFLN